ncbi:hypothetical protein B7R54_19445 [Subtercola boreus]|uniref:ABC transmembrane type-1 domain-containing protein n=1 Tax=Subtercola boreus TaxID=120213 RepID=A0A3E0VB07_9MICO|nr:hypothetical protein [Subtercola boreus]RFA06540.1 hypothetical protein B7R54_19445 [Subtercola boreus]
MGEPWSQHELPGAILQTAGLAAIGAGVTVLVALSITGLTVRHPGRFPRFLERAQCLVGSLPAIIIALGLVPITIRIVPALYLSVFTVVLAYVIIFLPRALVSLRADTCSRSARNST